MNNYRDSGQEGGPGAPMRRTVTRRQFIESGAALATLPPALVAAMGAAVPMPARASAVKALIIVQQPGSLRTVDPGRASEVDAAAISRALYDSLLSLKGADPAPAYATNWTVSPDGLTYTFDLHPDLEIQRRLTGHAGRLHLLVPSPAQQQVGRVMAARQC